ncbi:MAG TPA: hypothetical protein VH020_03065 [Stellaceae bacterium]|jgi:hypothetical protein|nr:hypothetical protein [Stellaceae bacterium]
MRAKALAFLLGAIIALGAANAQAAMNYRCLATCQEAGYAHKTCAARCMVAAPNQSADPLSSAKHGTDYRCVDKCTGTGRRREYCLRNCSY